MPKNYQVAYVIYKLPPSLTGAGLRILRYCDSVINERKIPFIITKSKQKKNFYKYQRDSKQFSFKENLFIEINEPSLGNDKNGFFKAIAYLVNLAFTFLQVFGKLYRNRNKFYILHCLGWNHISLSSVLACRLLRKKVILEVTMLNEPPIINENAGKNKKLITQFEQKIYQKASHYIALSIAIQTELASLKIPNNKITLIVNPVDTNKFFPVTDEKKIHLRTQFGLSNNTPIFIFVGALIHRKGIDSLIKIISALQTVFPNSKFIILGENSNTDEQLNYKNKIINHILHIEQIELTGMVKNVEEYLNISDYFIFPSLKEGLPNAVLEAMACGLVVLMNDIPGISDFIIEHGENGYIIPENYTEKYIEIIQHLEHNQQEYKIISDKAYTTILEDFQMTTRNNKLHNVYMQLINN